jgi:hypothetical protein
MNIPFDEYCARTQNHPETFYRIQVVTRDIPNPLVGDLDGSEVDIYQAATAEQRLLMLGQLFGHTVRWNVKSRFVQTWPAL